MKKMRYILPIALSLVLVCTNIVTLLLLFSKSKGGDISTADVYIEFDAALRAAGYAQTEKDYRYQMSGDGYSIEIVLELEQGRVYKNQYEFDVQDTVWMEQGSVYIRKQSLEAILNVRFSGRGESLNATPISFEPHEWTTCFAPLVAHAGGGYRTAEATYLYTNNFETLVQNYNLGHRVFEYDLLLTSDGELALLHDWAKAGSDGPISAAQWLAGPAAGTGTPMLWEDLLREMQVNQDIFIVTDIKGEELYFEVMQLLIQKTIAYDETLLERVIPQFYRIRDYDILMSYYPFQSVIYTLYGDGTNSTPDIIKLAAESEPIQVITVPVGSERFDEGIVEGLREVGVYTYVHTARTEVDLPELLATGAHGVYVDFVTPAEFQYYLEA